MKENLRIVHCGNFSEFKNGEVFYSMDRKISHGLVQNGHMVYNFSYRDKARMERFLAFKKRSIQKMNQKLIETCITLQPNLLLLAKCETIYPQTLKKIKEILPNIKIMQWFVDFLATEDRTFFEKLNYIDVFFQTDATRLEELSLKYQNTIFSYMPNISDPMFENVSSEKKEYDIIYIARDYQEDARAKFAELLIDFCNKEDLILKIYGSAGKPGIFGHAYQEEIAKAKIAINFNREDKIINGPDNRILGSSDRMNHFMGCGTCTFSPRIKGLDLLYKDNEDVVYFNDATDCFDKIKQYLKNDQYKNISVSGQQNAFKVSNAQRVTRFFLDVTYKNEFNDSYEWKDYIYFRGKKYV